ncbi:MAG: N-6 DNA methylase [Bacteroidales bacterium]|jgi:tRNA1(Val) A37 N6-methylase TrmN6|nr:N-6 DNA methylase [Bacteroidales bacterium]
MGSLINKHNIFTISNSVSVATRRNWERLGSDDVKERCSARANKRMSDKYIIPKESFDNIANIPKIEQIIEQIKVAKYDIDDVLFSLGINLLTNTQVTADNLNYIKSEYDLKIIDDLLKLKLPDESDLLGLIYQCLQTEGEKNIKGSYYTPQKVVQSMISDIKLKADDRVLDPCCGSSVFLLNIPDVKPQQIFGLDIDPVAVMISKINYFLKFPLTVQKPRIYESDYLELPNLLNTRIDNYQKDIVENSFNYIITNPPWGGISTVNHFSTNDIKSGEMFSLFLVKAFEQLKENGKMRFLLPCSILNVKTHQDIRKYLLEKTDLREIKLHPGSFSGVMTHYISLEAYKKIGISETFTISKNDKEYIIDKKTLNAENYYVMRTTSDIDEQIINTVYKKKRYDLSNAVWALGIVTGNNKDKLSNEPKDGFEPIYTGKEIDPFKLKKAKKYVLYNRENFQQVAKDEVYRADKKLAYKFISKKLVFSIDDSRHLFLNSANILIPNIPNMSIYSVAAFLNSELYQYLYQKMFGEIKILKSSLIALPFIEITAEQDNELSRKVENIMKDRQNDFFELQKYIYNLFELSDYQINHIKKELYGNTD